MGSVSAALQPRSQPDRDGLLKTQGSSARQSCPNNRRTLESHRTNLRPVPTRTVQKLFQRRRIRILLNVRRSRQCTASQPSHFFRFPLRASDIIPSSSSTGPDVQLAVKRLGLRSRASADRVEGTSDPLGSPL